MEKFLKISKVIIYTLLALFCISYGILLSNKSYKVTITYATSEFSDLLSKDKIVDFLRKSDTSKDLEKQINDNLTDFGPIKVKGYGDKFFDSFFGFILVSKEAGNIEKEIIFIDLENHNLGKLRLILSFYISLCIYLYLLKFKDIKSFVSNCFSKKMSFADFIELAFSKLKLFLKIFISVFIAILIISFFGE